MAGNGRVDSFYEERASTPQGRLGLAAAAAAASASRLLRAKMACSKLSSSEIAAGLGVSEDRVSEILSGEGNLHIATVARFLRVLGYELIIDAIPAESDRRY